MEIKLLINTESYNARKKNMIFFEKTYLNLIDLFFAIYNY